MRAALRAPRPLLCAAGVCAQTSKEGISLPAAAFAASRGHCECCFIISAHTHRRAAPPPKPQPTNRPTLPAAGGGPPLPPECVSVKKLVNGYSARGQGCSPGRASLPCELDFGHLLVLSRTRGNRGGPTPPTSPNPAHSSCPLARLRARARRGEAAYRQKGAEALCKAARGVGGGHGRAAAQAGGRRRAGRRGTGVARGRARHLRGAGGDRRVSAMPRRGEDEGRARVGLRPACGGAQGCAARRVATLLAVRHRQGHARPGRPQEPACFKTAGAQAVPEGTGDRSSARGCREARSRGRRTPSARVRARGKGVAARACAAGVWRSVPEAGHWLATARRVWNQCRYFGERVTSPRTHTRAVLRAGARRGARPCARARCGWCGPPLRGCGSANCSLWFAASTVGVCSQA